MTIVRRLSVARLTLPYEPCIWPQTLRIGAMTGTQHSGEGLDARRRKLLFRSWHRGMRENDLILGSFADARISALSDAEIDQYEEFLEQPDTEMFPWLTGEVAPPQPYAPLVAQIREFRQTIRF